MSRKIEGDWRVEYDNCSDDDGGFDEWWTVTNGEMSFRSYDKSAAEWLLKCIHGRATAKVDREVLIRFITWVRNHWALNAAASNAEIVEYFLTYKSPLIRDNKETLENKGGGNGTN